MPRCLLFGVLKKHWVHVSYFQKYISSNFKIQFTKNAKSVTTVVFPLYSSIGIFIGTDPSATWVKKEFVSLPVSVPVCVSLYLSIYFSLSLSLSLPLFLSSLSRFKMKNCLVHHPTNHKPGKHGNPCINISKIMIHTLIDLFQATHQKLAASDWLGCRPTFFSS